MTEMGVTFWTPGARPVAAGVGIAVHGLSGPAGPCPLTRTGSATFAAEGVIIAGSPAEVVERLGDVRLRPRAAVVLSTRTRGVEPVLDVLHSRFPGLPVIGGGAARLDAAGMVSEFGESMHGVDVEVLLVEEGDWQAETLVVHSITGPVLRVEAEGPRCIRRMRLGDEPWRSASDVLFAWQRLNGIDPADLESVTVADISGRTLHLTVDGTSLRSGSDLPADGLLVLRAAPPETIACQIAGFCAVSDALICACAGLAGRQRSLPVPGSGSLVGFCWGEVAPVAGRPVFANLLCARLRRV